MGGGDDGNAVTCGGWRDAGRSGGTRGARAALLRRREVPAAVPDRYCCQISMEVMLDPLTTPSGITYERASLREHLQKVGAFDPVTRAPLRLEQAVPNIALRETIREYLDEHPWAYESNL